MHRKCVRRGIKPSDKDHRSDNPETGRQGYNCRGCLHSFKPLNHPQHHLFLGLPWLQPVCLLPGRVLTLISDDHTDPHTELRATLASSLADSLYRGKVYMIYTMLWFVYVYILFYILCYGLCMCMFMWVCICGTGGCRPLLLNIFGDTISH